MLESLNRALRRIVLILFKYRILLVILISACLVWAWIFNLAAADFIEGGSRPFRAAWNGYGAINVAGLTIPLNLEGWADYDYYYISWADQFLRGVQPYTTEFDYQTIGGTVYNIPYFFPPLFLYLCAFGRVLPIQPFGIGLVITVFGYLTALPIYGVGKYLSDNPHVGEIAAATYLFNPIVLYHTVVDWLNPAPFVFFVMLSIYLIVSGHRVSGVLAMATAAMFKQTAFVLAIPLVCFFLRRPPQKDVAPETEALQEGKRSLPSDKLDLRSFSKIVLVVLLYAVALSVPYLLDPLNYGYFIFQRAGAFLLTDLATPPGDGLPMTLAVILIVMHAPEWLIQGVNLMTYYSVGLILGLLPILVQMLIEMKDDRNLTGYWRRMLYLTLLLLLWIHLFSPRGIYKYYLVALVPFFSILSSTTMCSKESGEFRPSLPMVVNPFVISILIIVPDRTIYMLYLILILLSYVFYRQLGLAYRLLGRTFRRGMNGLRHLRGHSEPPSSSSTLAEGR
ncbi:MAG: hypothetical protein C4K47_05965 [Candidatus Thorarchaeota archaeon]|nr:MAG: hypothetical protein C4K47_05965 [Candidatus Thorarchaeota archaeon]